MSLVRALAAAAIAAGWIGCEPGEPTVAPAESAVDAPPAVTSLASIEPSVPSAVILPPFEPVLSDPVLAPMPPIPVQASRAPVTRVSAPAPAAATASPAPVHPPLDILLRPARETGPLARPVDLGVRAEPLVAVPAGAAPGAIERLKRQLRLERRSQPIGPAGPRQGTHSETEAALRIPVDETVSVEGGVRVDQRDEPGAKAPQRRSTPRVGVEVRF